MINIENTFSKDVKAVLKLLSDNGYDSYIVGGAVRDSIMKRKISDYDIATNALPNEVKELFLNNNYKVIETGIKHGTVTVLLEHDSIEITTFRIESNYVDNRHPENVTYTNNLNEDLIRRDFTINAMAISINGELIDMHNGLSDIRNKVIRAVGNPNIRFQEDALRMLRAIRFSSKLNFRICENTADAIKINSSLISNISIERINNEMFMILSYNVSDKLSEFRDIFKYAYSFENDVIDKALAKIDNFPDCLMKLAYLYSFYNENDFLIRIEKLKLSKEKKNKIIAFYNNSKEYTYDTLDDYNLKLLYSKYGLELGYEIIKYICYYNNIDILIINMRIEQIKEEIYTIDTLCINGNDLIELGYYKEQISKALNILLDLVLSGKVKNERNDLIRALYTIDLDFMDYI